MRILLTGTGHETSEGVTVERLLEGIGATGRVAVEVNGRVVPRREHGRVALHEHDRVEVVQFVGGG